MRVKTYTICVLLSTLVAAVSSNENNTTEVTPLDLSNSDLGPDLLPQAESLIWNHLQDKIIQADDDATSDLPTNTTTLEEEEGDHDATATNTTLPLETHNNATLPSGTKTVPSSTSKNATQPSSTKPAHSPVINLSKPSGTQPRAAQMTGCRTQGQIAVTYSEGPSDATAKIVKNLNNADARANFFFNASWLYTQQYAMVVQNIYNAGHFVGMTYRVKNDDSSLWTDDELRQDIINNARTIETLIKVAPKYVRLHYTPKPDTRVEAILQDLGFVLVGYNLDSQDYSHKEPTGPNSIEDVYRKSFFHQKDTYDAKGSFISIQYDIPDTGALVAVPFMINAINEEGYTMVRLDGCLNDPAPYKKSADSKEYVADHFSFNGKDYHQGQKAISAEALVVEDWESKSDEDRMFGKKKKNEGSSVPLAWFASVALMLATLLFL